MIIAHTFKINILTSYRNASSKPLHNVLHGHHTSAKVWSILIFGFVSPDDILKFSVQSFELACPPFSWTPCAFVVYAFRECL